MSIREPERAIHVLLRILGPSTTEELERRVEGAGELVLDMERVRDLHRWPDGRWALFAREGG